MPSSLSARVATFVLIGSFMIPVLVASLGGLTHVLTCESRIETPFTFQIVPGAEPVLLSSEVLTRDQPSLLCGGLSVDMRARATSANHVAVEVPITNRSVDGWRGTVLLRLGDTTVPVDVGAVPAKTTRSDTVVFGLDEGLHEVSGSLFIGP